MEKNNGVLTENMETNTELDALFDAGIAYGKWCGYESLHDVIAALERDREALKAECLKYETELTSKEIELENVYKANKAIGIELESARRQMIELKA